MKLLWYASFFLSDFVLKKINHKIWGPKCSDSVSNTKYSCDVKYTKLKWLLKVSKKKNYRNIIFLHSMKCSKNFLITLSLSYSMEGVQHLKLDKLSTYFYISFFTHKIYIRVLCQIFSCQYCTPIFLKFSANF